MRSRLSTAFWKLYAPFSLILGLGMLGILCAFWMPLAFVLNLALPRKRSHYIGRLAIELGFNFYLVFLALFCGVRFDISIQDDQKQKGSSILVANHPSLLDAVIMLALVPNTICVMKSTLLENPLLGAAARMAGFIRNSDPFDMIAHAKEVIQESANLLLFPEGTRSKTCKKVSPLNQSAALLSSKLNLPIRTFLINYDQEFLGKNNRLLSIPRLPMKITVKSGKVLWPSKECVDITHDLEIYLNTELNDAI